MARTTSSSCPCSRRADKPCKRVVLCVGAENVQRRVLFLLAILQKKRKASTWSVQHFLARLFSNQHLSRLTPDLFLSPAPFPEPASTLNFQRPVRLNYSSIWKISSPVYTQPVGPSVIRAYYSQMKAHQKHSRVQSPVHVTRSILKRLSLCCYLISTI